MPFAYAVGRAAFRHLTLFVNERVLIPPSLMELARWMSRYYIADGMVQRGPFEIADLPGQGVRAGTLVWKAGMDQWRRADAVEEPLHWSVVGGA